MDIVNSRSGLLRLFVGTLGGLLLWACRNQADDGRLVVLPPTRWSVSGQISTPAGTSASGIFVFAEGTSYLATTNQDGRWTMSDLPSANYKLQARRDDLESADLGPLTLQVNPAKSQDQHIMPTTAMVLRARPPEPKTPETGSLRGNVRLAGAADNMAGIVVQVAGTYNRTVTDESGDYYLTALPAGDWTLLFSRKGWKKAQAKVAIIGGQENQGPIVELAPDESSASTVGRVIRGQIMMTDVEGKPSAEFMQVIVFLEGSMHLAVPDAEGKFTFSGLTPSRYTVMGAAPGFVLRDKIDVDLTSLEATEVVIELDENPDLARKFGTVLGKAIYKTPLQSDDHSGIIISLTGTNLVAITDRDGNYQISNVPPGTYLLRAQAEGQASQFVEKVEVRAGEKTTIQDLVLEPYIAPPEVVYTDPADGRGDVTLVRDTPVFIRFSKKMKPETVKVAFSISPPVAARLYMGRENALSDFDLLFIQLLGAPGIENSEPLHYSTTYKITISDLATDFQGAQMREPFSFEFTMGEPQIVSTIPARGQRNTLINMSNPIVVSFNAQMNHESFNSDNVRIRPEPIGQPTIQTFDDPVTGWTELSIYVPLEMDKEYSVSLGGNWQTVDGSKIANMPYRFNFKTAKLQEFMPYSGTKEKDRR